jgi:hypothetical protein
MDKVWVLQTAMHIFHTDAQNAMLLVAFVVMLAIMLPVLGIGLCFKKHFRTVMVAQMLAGFVALIAAAVVTAHLDTEPNRFMPPYAWPAQSMTQICKDDADYLKWNALPIYNTWCVPFIRYQHDYAYWLQHGELPK